MPAATATPDAVLLGVHGPSLLTAGRMLHGFASGLGSRALGAYIVDSAPIAELAAAVTARAPMCGLTTGVLASVGDA